MTDNRFALVEFNGDQLLTIFDGQTVRVAMKPMVEALGVDWRSQRTKIMGDPVLSKGVALNTTPSEGGPQQTLTLPIDLMQGWLFKLNPERVGPEARERVIAYQRECYQVLHDYWVKGSAINPRSGQSSVSGVQDVLKLLEAVKRETNPAAREMIYGMLEQAAQSRGVPVPTLEALSPTINDDAAAAALLARIDALLLERPELDHHRQDHLIAVRPPELAKAGIVIGKAMRAALRRHERFQTEGSVNSGQIRKGVFCMVFQAA